MKIGIDCRIYSPQFTGIGRYTHELVAGLIEKNKNSPEPAQIVLFFNQPEYDKFQDQPHTKKVLVKARHYSLAEQTTFLKKLLDEKLDLMHFPHFNVPFLYRRPYIVTIHDLILSFFPGKKMNRWYHRLAYSLTIKNAVRHAKKIIAVSGSTKQDILTHLPAKDDKIQVVYNGVSDDFRPLVHYTECLDTLNKYRINEFQFILYTGVWRSHKNLPRLIQAFALLEEKKNFHIKLVITGNPDPFYPEVREMVKRHNLENDVIFTGLVSEKELLHLYNAASIYAFPSLYEGFGLPPLEAMKCGTPVVASRSSSIPEICDGCALFFDPYSVDDIAKKIEYLYKDPAKQAELIEKGYRHVKKFTWKKNVDQTYDIFTDVINSNKHVRAFPKLSRKSY